MKNNLRETLLELNISQKIIDIVLEISQNEEEAISKAFDMNEKDKNSSDISNKYKMAFVVRKDLNMGTGKIAAQVAHASIIISFRKL